MILDAGEIAADIGNGLFGWVRKRWGLVGVTVVTAAVYFVGWTFFFGLCFSYDRNVRGCLDAATYVTGLLLIIPSAFLILAGIIYGIRRVFGLMPKKR